MGEEMWIWTKIVQGEYNPLSHGIQALTKAPTGTLGLKLLDRPSGRRVKSQAIGQGKDARRAGHGSRRKSSIVSIHI